jgi:hypothetical protein
MKYRGGCRAIALVLAVFISLIVFLFDTAANYISGCTPTLLQQFSSTDLAKQYVSDYKYQLDKEYSYFTGNEPVNWDIKRTSGGCVISASSTTGIGGRITIYHGDSFFINTSDHKIYPQSTGSQNFLDDYHFSTDLYGTNTDPEATMTYVSEVSRVQTEIAPSGRTPAIPLNSMNSKLPNNCIEWSEITASDKGRTLCVYGTVIDAYFGGDIYYLMFSKDPNAFRFIVLNDYYFKDVKGNCAMATGVVKTYNKMPYIEVPDKLSHCQ